MNLFITGCLIGFSVAIPIGPIGILCIQRTLLYTQLAGILTGLGVASADAIYGYIAAFGLSFIYNFINSQQFNIKMMGSLLMLFIGLKTVSMKNFGSNLIRLPSKVGYLRDYTSALILTLTNPMTLFLFTAIFSWFGIDIERESFNHCMLLVLGIFTGSFSWFLTLSTIVNLFRNKFSFLYLLWLNKISGISIIIFSLITFLSAISSKF